MPYHLEFEIKALPPMTNSLRVHWAKKLKISRQWKLLVGCSIGARRPNKPLTSAKVTITRCSSHPPDYDGLVSSGKHLLDGLTAYGVIIDDNMGVIGQPAYLWERAPKGLGKIKVIVESLENQDLNSQPV